ncbi:hypothetical protein KJY73_16425 [Bowmanella sp. Y26]|uniref:KOW domain-containing protein n=1 Tax=Bowmanella yangjiangensis TaxID=2811230 RepID=A0ABS3CYF0_9ALTE|nr:DUF3912 family protein [Bowmanella yangjiangensis]MBN7822123.1 hypothetical protein [Bowmanella yangjiangensis]MBT1065177.1 hypothetical protein [Bowmanella yangjiangensis]
MPVTKAQPDLPSPPPSLLGRCVYIKRGPYQGRTAKVLRKMGDNTYQLGEQELGPETIVVNRDDVIAGRRSNGKKRAK